MAKIKVGINGFGKIGRLVVAALLQCDGVEIVAINEPDIFTNFMAYGLRYGCFYPDVKVKDDRTLLFAEQSVPVYRYRKPEEIPWGKIGAVYVVEATGSFTDMDGAAAHLKGGAKKVVIAAASKDAPMFVVGVNEEKYTPDLKIVSVASCVTNCFAPIAKVLHDTFGVAACHLSAVRSTPVTQNTTSEVRKPAFFLHTPSSIGEGMAVGHVIPALDGKLTDMTFHLMTTDVYVVDITVVLDKPATYDQIKGVIKEASEGNLKGILSYADKGVQTTHVVGTGSSCVFDAKAGVAHNGKFAKLVAWHDGDWGYCNRVVDLIKHMASSAH